MVRIKYKVLFLIIYLVFKVLFLIIYLVFNLIAIVCKCCSVQLSRFRNQIFKNWCNYSFVYIFLIVRKCMNYVMRTGC